jgi:hypothetical protein
MTSALLVGAAPAVASAQEDSARKEERREVRQEWLEREVWHQFQTRPDKWLEGIELGPEQRDRIEEIRHQTLERVKGIGRDVDARQENGKPVGVFRDRLVELMANMRQEIRGVLGERQHERFDKNVAELPKPWT